MIIIIQFQSTFDASILLVLIFLAHFHRIAGAKWLGADRRVEEGFGGEGEFVRRGKLCNHLKEKSLGSVDSTMNLFIKSES